MCSNVAGVKYLAVLLAMIVLILLTIHGVVSCIMYHDGTMEQAILLVNPEQATLGGWLLPAPPPPYYH